MSADPARGARGRAVLLALGGGAALFAVAAPSWFSVRVPTVLQGELVVGVSGAGAVPAITGVALVLLAAGGALGIVGRAGRRVVGAFVAAAAVIAAWLVVDALRAPAVALRRPVVEHTGVGAVPETVTVAPWPVATLVLTVAIALLGAFHAWGRGAWPAPGSRVRRATDRSAGHEQTEYTNDPTSTWDALSDGDDPTAPGPLP